MALHRIQYRVYCVVLRSRSRYSSKIKRIDLGRLFRVSKLFLLFLLISSFGIVPILHAQEDTLTVSRGLNSALNPLQTDSTTLNVDSLSTITPDSLLLSETDFFPTSIFYDARDSIVFDLLSETVYLYGDAVVKYESIELRAEYIEYAMGKGQACANGVRDSLGVVVGVPILIDDGQQFSQKTMCYNFKTKRGTSHEVITNDGEIFVHSEVAKRQTNEWVHMKSGKLTSCDADVPHYHFYVGKAIVVPQDKIVTGPINLRVRVPLPIIEIKGGKRFKKPFGLKLSLPDIVKKTPLVLPFAFFPNKIESSHGIILPSYGDSEVLGFFLQNGGYYLPINKHIDTRLLFDVYSRGSWSVQNLTSYNKRYKYNGTFNISRTVTKSGFSELPSFSKNTNFFVRWKHSKDSKARPNSRFSADVNMGSSNNFRNNLNSSQQDYVSSSFSSSVQWSRGWTGRPYNLAISARQNQNVTSGNVDVTLPSATFTVNRFNLPLGFLKKNTASSKWFDKIGVTYSTRFDNVLNTTDKELRLNRANQLLNEARNGVKHTAAVSTSVKALNNFVSITPSFNYNEVWAFRQVERSFDEETQVASRDTVGGFRSGRSWSTSVNATTKLFGMYQFKRAKNVKAMRHVITPTLGLRYTPYRNYTEYGFFGDDGQLESYSPFDVAAFRPGNSQESGAVTFGLQNNLEIKVRDKKADKLAWKKVKLLEGFNVSSSYNMLADSMNLADFNIRAFTTIYKNLKLSMNSALSPYDRNLEGIQVGDYLWDTQRKLVRMRSLDGSLRMQFSSKNTQDFNEVPQGATQEEIDFIKNTQNDYVDLTQSWTLNVGYTFNLRKNWDKEALRDTIALRHAITMNASVNVFRNWFLTYDGGYDLQNKDFTPTTISLYWDLHCWEFAFNWIPFGDRRSYNVQLNVKSSLLKDLKLQKRQNYGDPNLLY